MPEEIVYVLGTPGSNTVKIGMTTNLTKRLRDIQRMSPVPLAALWTTPGGRELEVRLHRHFASLRSHGEWFTFTEGDPVAQIKAAVESAPWSGTQMRLRKPQAIESNAPRVSKERFAEMLEASHRAGAFDTSGLQEVIAARIAELEQIPDLVERFNQVRAFRQQIAEGRARFTAEARRGIVELKKSGLTWRQIGELLGMSGARAEQIAKSA
ncbi:GIY-YIG nuclease family protein [Streptomyces nigra]|uniref:GIY-YIG nuclease family protein n=1 Tax=Streptomyces nigra TaxID=1827580 RepID=UPI0036AFE244